MEDMDIANMLIKSKINALNRVVEQINKEIEVYTKMMGEQ